MARLAISHRLFARAIFCHQREKQNCSNVSRPCSRYTQFATATPRTGPRWANRAKAIACSCVMVAQE